MKKRILISGANGLLGQKLTDLYLQKPDKEVLLSGIGPSRHPLSSSINYTELDITDQKAVDRLFEDFKPDTLIHTAAMTNVDACETDREGCDRLNVEAVRYLALACRKHGTHMVHVSTDFIFNGTHGPLDENEIPDPLSYYGLSKLKGEQIVQELVPVWTILRTVLVYGVVSDMSRSNIVLWAKSALEKQQSVKVVDDQYRTPTLAEDLATGCFLAENLNAKGIFNISGKDFMSIYELVERVAAFFGLKMDNVQRTDSSSLSQPARRPPVTGFIIDKARRELHYEPHSFEEGLAMVKTQLSIGAK